MRQASDNSKDDRAGPDERYRPVAAEHLRTLPGPPQSPVSLDALGKALSASISDLLGPRVRFALTACDELQYADYLKSVDDASCCWILESSIAAVWVELSPRIAEGAAGLLLGGTGARKRLGGGLTVIERSVLHRFIDAIADAAGRFLNAELMRGGSGAPRTDLDEQVVVAEFSFALGDSDGTMHLCVPRKLLDRTPEGDQTQARGPKESPSAAREVELAVVAGETSISPDELAKLAPGDVLVTDADADDEIVVRLDGRNAFAGRLGSRNGKRVVTILRPLDGGEDE